MIIPFACTFGNYTLMGDILIGTHSDNKSYKKPSDLCITKYLGLIKYGVGLQINLSHTVFKCR